MRSPKPARLIALVLGLGLSAFASIPAANADVTFFIQREGSPQDTGQQAFLAAAPGAAVQDFDDPAFGPDGTELPNVAVGPFQFGLASAFSDGTPCVPVMGYSPEFCVEGKMYNMTVFSAGSTLTLTPVGGQPIGAVGLWVFDDGRALDSVYLVQVVELNGNTAQVVLANEIPRDYYNHEIEGFVGAASDVGLASFTIMAVSPDTGLIQADHFEIDYLTVAAVPPPAATDDGGGDAGGNDGGGSGMGDGSDGASDDGSGGGAGDGSGDTADDDDGTCPRHGRHHHGHGRGHDQPGGGHDHEGHHRPHHEPPAPPPPPPPARNGNPGGRR